VLPLDKVIFNTEAHAFPRFELGKLFFTGWKRKQRDRMGNIVDEKSSPPAQKGADQKKPAENIKTVHVKAADEA